VAVHAGGAGGACLPYKAISQKLVEILSMEDLARSLLVVDASGVGLAVMEMFTEDVAKNKTRCSGYVAIQITAGRSVSNVGQGIWHVAKAELASTIKSVFSAGRLLVLKDVAERKTLIQEVRNFETKITENGVETFEARTGKHDDILLATAQGVWVAEQNMRGIIQWPESTPTVPTFMRAR
jgi:hypothetical protein